MLNLKTAKAVWNAPKLKKIAASLAEAAGANPGDGPVGQKS